MNYDDWKATDPADGPWQDRPARVPETVDTCRDCGAVVTEGAHGTFDGISCDGCWRWRAARCLEFDPRPRPQLEAALRKGAA